MLERYELETFLTLAEELHFGRTAERTHVSTARVSQTIKKLERRVGAPLFNRTSRHVELTPSGASCTTTCGPGGRPSWPVSNARSGRAAASAGPCVPAS